MARSRGVEPVFFDRPAEYREERARIDALTGCIAEHEADLVFAVGGDGTVRLCAEAIAEHDATLAIVPRGAANLVAHGLGLPSRLDAALRVGFGESERLMDVTLANGETSLAMAGMGADAAVVHATPALFKRRLGWLGYAVVALPHLHGSPSEFEIRLDDEAPLRCVAHSVVVANVGLLPGGVTLLPDARPDDGLLDIGILAPDGVLGWAQLGARLVSEHFHLVDDADPTHAHSRVLGRPIEHHQAREVTIRADRVLACEVDGEVIGTSSVMTARVQPAVLRVRVPG